MSTVTLRRLRPDLAAQLNQLELAAAVLERDARNGRAILIELGLASPLAAQHLSWLEAATGLWARTVKRTWRPAVRSFAAVKRIAQSQEVATGVRVTWGMLQEGVVYLSIAFAVMIPLVLAIIVFAPPV
jgi:hypothetical protein